MNPAVNELAISVLRKPLDECTLTELRQLAQRFPWFGPAQLLYAKKLQAGNATLYEEQVQKASLYFSNRFWLHHLLNDIEPNDFIIREPAQEARNLQEPVEVVVASSLPEPISTERKSDDQVLTNTLDENNEEKESMVPINEEASVPENEPPMEIPKLKIEPIDESKSSLTFEPYHTVDYFASQGIKFKEEEKPGDRFGQQLKSFTEWLKSMKKVPASEVEKMAFTDKSGEKKVEQMAEHSLAERHIVTEAMAEVWIKQGNKPKAEEIYRKLSLLDPSKTAYFAAKIEDLKKTS